MSRDMMSEETRRFLIVLPRVTHLQFLVLRLLMGGEMTGKQLREALAAEGEKKGLPAFYQLMSRLEEDGLVEGEYREVVVAGQRIRERNYWITGEGQVAVDEVRQFVFEGLRAGPSFGDGTMPGFAT